MTAPAGTIVVGIDGSTDSKAALGWAVEQAVAEHRGLTLAHSIQAVTSAYLDAGMAYSTAAVSAMQACGQELLDEARSTVARTAPDLEVFDAMQLSDPREQLLTLSETAAMVVIGSSGRGRLASLLLGSVGVTLVRHSECPVVVHRGGDVDQQRHGVVVAADTCAESAPVLEFAYREAELRQLPLTVLHCLWEVAGSHALEIMQRTASEVEYADVAMGESMAGMAEKYPDVIVITQLSRGLPQDVLLDLSETMSLVVVGSHQRTRVEHLWHGATSVAAVEQATCPVAVVPVRRP